MKIEFLQSKEIKSFKKTSGTISDQIGFVDLPVPIVHPMFLKTVTCRDLINSTYLNKDDIDAVIHFKYVDTKTAVISSIKKEGMQRGGEAIRELSKNHAKGVKALETADFVLSALPVIDESILEYSPDKDKTLKLYKMVFKSIDRICSLQHNGGSIESLENERFVLQEHTEKLFKNLIAIKKHCEASKNQEMVEKVTLCLGAKSIQG